MIKYVQGDILLSKAQAVAHGVAPNDHFSSGLALALRENWPSLAKDFRHYCHSHAPKVGSVWSWVGANGVHVYNLMTQEQAPNEHAHPGQAKLESVNHALKELSQQIKKDNIKSLAIPHVATGVGGLSWSEVKPLVEKHLGEAGIPVYVYEYKKGVEAHEV